MVCPNCPNIFPFLWGFQEISISYYSRMTIYIHIYYTYYIYIYINMPPWLDLCSLAGQAPRASVRSDVRSDVRDSQSLGASGASADDQPEGAAISGWIRGFDGGLRGDHDVLEKTTAAWGYMLRNPQWMVCSDDFRWKMESVFWFLLYFLSSSKWI